MKPWRVAAWRKCPKAPGRWKNGWDDDGHGTPVHVKVKVTITEDEFLADFTGSDPQVAGCVNTGATAAYAGVKVIFMSIIDRNWRSTTVCLRRCASSVKRGSVMQAKRPAATSCYYESMIYAIDLVWKALAPVFPESLGAGHLLSVCTVLMAGKHQDFGNEYLISSRQLVAGGPAGAMTDRWDSSVSVTARPITSQWKWLKPGMGSG